MIEYYVFADTFHYLRSEFNDNALSKKTFNGKEISKIDNTDIIYTEVQKRVFSGDVSKVENIHFVKTTFFDRDLFRRLYPNIKVKNSPTTADLIVYDETSINKITKKQIRLEKYKYQDEIFYLTWCSSFQELRSCLQTKIDNTKSSYWEQKYAVDIKKKMESMDKDSIFYKIVMSEKIETISAIELSDYHDELMAAKAPFILSTEILNVIESNSRTSDLTLEYAFSLMRQISAEDKNTQKAALDTLIMYNTEKYWPIQYALVLLMPLFIKEGFQSLDKKAKIFLESSLTKTRFRLDPNTMWRDVNNEITCFNWIESFLKLLEQASGLNKVNKNILYNLLKSNELKETIYKILSSNSLVRYDKFNASLAKTKINKIDFEITAEWAKEYEIKNIEMPTNTNIDEFSVEFV